jgi:hypothetical protein
MFCLCTDDCHVMLMLTSRCDYGDVGFTVPGVLSAVRDIAVPGVQGGTGHCRKRGLPQAEGMHTALHRQG